MSSEGSSVGFGSTVRIKSTPETEAAGYAGKEAICSGESIPSTSGVEVFGQLREDYAVSVSLLESEDEIWLDPSLLELVHDGVGMTIELEGVDKKWTRTEDGSWQETGNAVKKRPWWKFWQAARASSNHLIGALSPL